MINWTLTARSAHERAKAKARTRARVKRTLPYTGERRANSARRPATVHNGQVLFDRGPAKLPVATIRSHAWSRAAAASRLRGALAASWQWFKPRTVPVIVAGIGACALLAATNYLTNLAREVPAQPTVEHVATLRVESVQPAAAITILDAEPTQLTIDYRPAPLGRVMQLPASGYQVKLIPLHPQP
jgi:hypothetical protein